MQVRFGEEKRICASYSTQDHRLGWVYLSTVLDDFSRYIIAWKLCTTMRAEDVTDTLELALTASGCDSAKVLHKPRLLSDNGPSYIATELAEWIDANGMSHVRGAPLHPQTQGKIERWHQTLKNRILLTMEIAVAATGSVQYLRDRRDRGHAVEVRELLGHLDLGRRAGRRR